MKNILVLILIVFNAYGFDLGGLTQKLTDNIGKSVTDKKTEKRTDSFNGIQTQQEEQESSLGDDEELRNHFRSIKVLKTKAKKGDIAFGDISYSMPYEEVLQHVCSFKTFKHIEYGQRGRVITKEELCKKDSTFPLKIMSARSNKIDTFNFKGKEIDIMSYDNFSFTAGPLFIKGIEFDVKFTLDGYYHPDVIKGMLLDGNVPMYYISGVTKESVVDKYMLGTKPHVSKWVRRVAFIGLRSVELIPKNRRLYKEKKEEIVAIFHKKYPQLKDERYSYGKHYIVEQGNNTLDIKFTNARQKDNKIVYSFQECNKCDKYNELFKKDRDKELAKKGDDSDSI